MRTSPRGLYPFRLRHLSLPTTCLWSCQTGRSTMRPPGPKVNHLRGTIPSKPGKSSYKIGCPRATAPDTAPAVESASRPSCDGHRVPCISIVMLRSSSVQFPLSRRRQPPSFPLDYYYIPPFVFLVLPLSPTSSGWLLEPLTGFRYAFYDTRRLYYNKCYQTNSRPPR